LLPVADHGPLDAELLADLRPCEMLDAAHAGGGVRDLLRVRLGVIDELLPRLPGCIPPHHDAAEVVRYADDPGKVGDRVVVDLAHMRRTQDVRRNVRDRVAVRLHAHDSGAGKRRRGAGFVLDDHPLPKLPGRCLRQCAEGEIRRTARAVADQQGDAAFGKTLRPTAGGCRGK
jgi:hypothetical protein